MASESKEDPNEQLSKLALNDAQHDFGEKNVAPLPGRLPPFNASVLKSVSGDYAPLDEVQTLNSVVDGLKATIEELVIDGETTITTERQLTYQSVKKISIDDGGVDIVVKGGLNQAVFVVDYSQHNFIKKLKDGVKGEQIVYYVLTPEVINDPAPKTNVDDPVFRKDTGVNVVPCVQSGQDITTYQGGLTFDPNTPLQNFSSQYTLSLSPINKQRQVNLKITYGNMVAEFKDSKKQNSIRELVSVLMKLFEKLIPLGKSSNSKQAFNIASNWAQKRSGDWLQALACMDLATRTFKTVDGKDVGPFADKNNVYYVTHDQIALAYALFIGVNAIFIPFGKTGDKYTAVIFKRTSTETNYASFCTQQLTGKDIEKVRAFLLRITETRTEQLGTNKSVIKQEIKKLNTGIGEYSAYEESVKKILLNALEHSFVEHQVPDVNPAGLDDADVCKKYKSYVAGLKLMEEHGENPNIQPFLIALRQTDRYKLLENWTTLPSMSVTKRIMNLFKQTDERDLYMFLPDIANSKDEKMKSDIATIFHQEFGKLDTYGFWGSSGRSRDKKLSAYKQLFAQVEVFLGKGLEDFKKALAIPDIEPVQEDPNPFYNLLLIARIAAADEEAAVPRLPDFVTELTTEEAATILTQMGQRGGYAGPLTQYIQGSSVKSVTLPLLTAHLLLDTVEPLLPVVLLLNGIFAGLEPRTVTSLDFETIYRFSWFLFELSRKAIDGNTLRALFFTYGNTDAGRNDLLEKLGPDYEPFAILASSYASTVSGTLTLGDPAIADFTMIKEVFDQSKVIEVERDYSTFYAGVLKGYMDRVFPAIPVIPKTPDKSGTATPEFGTPGSAERSFVSSLASDPRSQSLSPDRSIDPQSLSLPLSLGSQSDTSPVPSAASSPVPSPERRIRSRSPSLDAENEQPSRPQPPPPSSSGGRLKTPRASKSSRRTRRARRSGRST